jgi:hypothetical protein
MADYYTEFSFVVENLTLEEAEWLALHYLTKWEDDSTFKDCFGMEIQDSPNMQAWFHDDGGQPNLDALLDFLTKFLSGFRKDSSIFFEWGRTCSAPRTDGFGGGAALVTSTTAVSRSTTDLQNMLHDDAVNHPRAQ